MKITHLSISTIFILFILSFSLVHFVTPSNAMSKQVPQTSIAQVATPSAKVINENPAYPNIDQDISITADVIAPVGVDKNQVDLIYNYRSTSGQGQISMVGNPSSLTPNSFDSITAPAANQKQVNYTYVSDYIDNVAIIIKAGGTGNTNFVSYTYSYYDLSTSAWVELDSNSGISQSSLTFSHTGVMGGFSFSAVVQRGTGSQTPADPTIDPTSVIEATRQFSATITAPGVSTAIDYYIRAVDLNGGVFYSGNYTIYANSKPSLVSFNNLPSQINGTTGFLLNTTVHDGDGYGQLTTVRAYYKPVSATYWQYQDLEFDLAINANDAIYLAQLNMAQFTGYEENLQLYLNITDTVDGAAQTPQKSSSTYIFLDSRGPTLQNSINITANPLINNSTKINSTITLAMIIVDANGVRSAVIVFSLNNGTEIQQPLVNASTLQQSDTLESFTFEFPGYLNNTDIVYYIVTTDYLNNTYISPKYQLFVDAEAPVLVEQAAAPQYPTPSTGTTIVYNIWDAAGLKTQQFYYRYKNDTTWNSTTPEIINYDNEINQEESFGLFPLDNTTDIGNIKDDGVTSFSLNISPTISADDALVDIEFTHQRSTDLRIYMIYLNSSYLIFDRESGSNVTFSLRKYINIGSLNAGNITIEVHDLVAEFTGVMNSISIRLIDYAIPLDYTYKAIIPPTINDTTVFYFMTLEDNLGNLRNTTVFSIYFDGTAPQITEFTKYSGNINANGARSLPVTVSVFDGGTIDTVELYYKYQVENEWNILPMGFNNVSMKYSSKLPLFGMNGSLMYQIRCFDKAGFSSNSTEISFTYSNANAPEIQLLTDISQPIDLSNSNILRLEVQVSADSNISSVQLVYSLNGAENITVSMGKIESNKYGYDIVVDTKDGDVEFSFLAIDNDQQQTATDNFSLTFVNADVSNIADFLPYAVGVGAVAVIATIGTIITKKIKSKPSSIFSKKPADLDDSWDSEW